MGREAMEKTLGEEVPGGEGGYVNQSTRHVSEENFLDPSSSPSQAPREFSPQLLFNTINERLQARPVDGCLAVSDQPK